MTTFPALIPSSRTFTPGEYPATALAGFSGKQGRVRHSNVFLDGQLRLTYKAISEADMLLLWNHFTSQQGGFQAFTLPTETVSYDDLDDYVPDSYRWIYLPDGSVEDLPCGGHNVSLTLQCVPPAPASAAGAELGLRLSLVAGQAGVGIPGANLTLSLSLDPGAATAS